MTVQSSNKVAAAVYGVARGIAAETDEREREGRRRHSISLHNNTSAMIEEDDDDGDDEYVSRPSFSVGFDRGIVLEGEAADMSEYSYDHSSNGDERSSSSELQHQQTYWHEPIKVGYAFGPKKMTTMGVVMAEASRVQVIHEETCEEDEDVGEDVGEVNGDDVGYDEQVQGEESDDKAIPTEGRNNAVFAREKDENTGEMKDNNFEGTVRNGGAYHSPPVRTKLTCDALRSLVDSTAATEGRDRRGQMSSIICLNNTDETDIQHIVQYFRSNCSSAGGSVAGSMSETTASTLTTAYGHGGGSCSCSCSGHDSHLIQHQKRGGLRQRKKRLRRQPVHISFVPLDCDQPLEDQHGGNFDLILHKLTEDILSCSLMTENDMNCCLAGNNNRGKINGHFPEILTVTAEDNVASRRRVQALKDYHRDHDYCCLVDDPSNVQTVMSRSDIANVLRACLRGVYSMSGIPVRSPRFIVIGGDMESYKRNESEPPDAISQSQAQRLKEQLTQEDISMPMIVKPLIAAGTKQSHSMLIAIQDSAIPKLPCKSIAQEYVNHNATLYKVYVLGDFVSVFDRPSLPNLPDDISSVATTDLVRFDSQRPYPTMNDFGLDVGPTKNTCEVSPHLQVTADEVRPIVDVLKKAFGLEMFGFDVLLGEDGEYLVVDVNYFPSYKEVKDFPLLLAQYLTQRVLEQRHKKRETEMTYTNKRNAVLSSGITKN